MTEQTAIAHALVRSLFEDGRLDEHLVVQFAEGSKFDEANWNLFASVGITPSYMREGNFGVAGVQQNITYKRELMAGDVIEVRSRIVEIREKVIRFVHEMTNVETQEIAATCEITAVHMDRKTRKSCPFPEAVRRAAEERVAGQ